MPWAIPCGAMSDYTEYAYEEPLYQGGFVWIISTSPSAPKTVTAMKPLPTAAISATARADYNSCGNGIVYGNGEESPKMQAVKYNYQNIIAEVADTKVPSSLTAPCSQTPAPLTAWPFWRAS